MLSKHAGKWVIRIAGAAVGIPILLVVAFILTTLISQWPRTSYIIDHWRYQFKVAYYPGGGVIGGNHALKVSVTGGKWRNQILVKAEAADSLDVVFVESDVVRVVVLKRFYESISQYRWHQRDSATFDPAGDVRPVEFSRPGH